MKKKIVVTGGAGYIGAHAVLELHQAGYTPIVIDNFSRSTDALLKGLNSLVGGDVIFYEGDCLDIQFLREVFKKQAPDGVIHFAAYKSVGESVQNPLLYYQNNLESLTTLLRVMLECGVKDLIFSSSCTVYGQPDRIPVDETAPFKRAESPYGATKQMCERILEDTYVRGLRAVSLRYFNPIGAHPSALIGELPIGMPNNLVPFVTQTAIGKREKLIVFGNTYNTPDGSNIRDFIHVVDLAKAHVKALDFLAARDSANCYEVFNIGTGVGVSVLEIVNRFQTATGVKLNYEIGEPRPGDVEKTYADSTKANRLLLWKAEISLDDALRDAWRWERSLNTKK